MPEPGKLFIVSTPIGNLGDISKRAVETLSAVDFILAEDTRRSGLLLKYLGIKNRLISCYDHNEAVRAKELVEHLQSGKSAALISDAGTPAVSDPGYRIVNACIENNIEVVSVPGPCAAVAALSLSGLSSDRFTFEGFLPPKGAKRQKRLEAVLASPCTSIIYESTHKILRLVKEIAVLDPERFLVIAREMTKMYEETLRGTASELLSVIEKRGGIKGEIVVLVPPNREKGK